MFSWNLSRSRQPNPTPALSHQVRVMHVVETRRLCMGVPRMCPRSAANCVIVATALSLPISSMASAQIEDAIVDPAAYAVYAAVLPSRWALPDRCLATHRVPVFV